MGKAPIVTRPRSCGSKTQAKKHGRRSHFLGAALEIRESNSWPLEASQAARLGDIQKAELYFVDTADTDLDATSAGVAAGFRIAALGGLWRVAVFGFAGLSFVEDGMQLDPDLPPKLGPARVPVSVAAVPIRVEIERPMGSIRVSLEQDDAVRVPVKGETSQLVQRSRPLRLAWNADSQPFP